MKEKRISILGDSISTWQGFTPEGFVFYGPWNSQETGLTSVEDTWWMKVIRACGGKLGCNHSLSGSLVAGRSVTSATSRKRICALGENGTPDVILVAMGANDWGFGFLPEEFESEYRRMLHSLKTVYPQAEIWCATLVEGLAACQEDQFFFDVDGMISRKVYSDIIRRAARESDVYVADLASYNKSYASLDGVHPNKEGMELLARLWILELEGRADEKVGSCSS